MTNVRPVEARDLAALADLEAATFGDDAYPSYVLRQAFDAYAATFLLAEDDRLLGYVLGSFSRHRESAWILALAVDGSARRRGTGRLLMQRALEELSSLGASEARLHVAPTNVSARALYSSLGFADVEQVRDCFGPRADRIVMRAVLPSSAGA